MSDRKRGRAGAGADGSTRRARRPALAPEALEARQLLAAQLDPIPAVSVPASLGVPIPLASTNPDPQSYSITANNDVQVKVTPARGQFLTLEVHHDSSGAGDISFDGNLTFQLFDDLTPITASMIEKLVTQGYYTSPTTNGTFPHKNFHRIAPFSSGFAVQGGSANGDGTGNPIPNFPDELLQQLSAFTGSGQLVEANTGRPDTSNSQFFITTGSPRELDFGYTVFGQLVAGQDILREMTQVAKTATNPIDPTPTGPVSPILITAASLSGTSADGVLHVDATGAIAGQTANVTVKATDLKDGTSTTQTFPINVVANAKAATEKTVLGPVSGLTLAPGQTSTFQLPTIAVNPAARPVYVANAGLTTGGTGTSSFTPFGPTSKATATVDATGKVTVTAAAGAAGTQNLLVGVADSAAPGFNANSPSSYYYHQVTVTVAATAKPTANPATYATSENTQIRITLAGTPGGAGQTLTFSAPARSTHGTLSAVPGSTNQYSYTPDINYIGPDSFPFTAATATTPPVTSDPATVTINVTPGTMKPNPPTANAGAVSTAANAAASGTVTASAPNAGDVLTYAVSTPPAFGTLTSFNGQTGAFTYKPGTNFVGADSFQFTATVASGPDAGQVSKPATFTITSTPGDTKSVRIVGNVLVVTPPPRTDGGINTIAVDQATFSTAGPVVRVTVNGVVDAQFFRVSDVHSVVVYGSKANDDITVGNALTLPATLDGGHGGRNVVQAGGGGSILHGWFGRNKLTGGPAEDTLIGRAGHVRFGKSPGNDYYVAVRTFPHTGPAHHAGRHPIAHEYKPVGNHFVEVPFKHLPAQAFRNGRTRVGLPFGSNGQVVTTGTGTGTGSSLNGVQSIPLGSLGQPGSTGAGGGTGTPITGGGTGLGGGTTSGGGTGTGGTTTGGTGGTTTGGTGGTVGGTIPGGLTTP